MTTPTRTRNAGDPDPRPAVHTAQTWTGNAFTPPPDWATQTLTILMPRERQTP